MSAYTVESAQVVLPCSEPISATIEFFTGHGFKVRTIVPADHPRMAVLEGHGLTVRLEVGGDAPPARLRLLTTAGAGHLQLVVDPITRASITALADVLSELDA